MAQFEPKSRTLVGPGGVLTVRQDDEVARRLLMLIEGECEEAGPLQAARKFGYSKQRYFQLRAAFEQYGTRGLRSRKRGPKVNYRRTDEVVRQVIRHRFLDGDATAGVIAQKLRQSGQVISTRSVERVIAECGLQKTALPVWMTSTATVAPMWSCVVGFPSTWLIGCLAGLMVRSPQVGSSEEIRN